jgi:hypothetical protein
MRELGRKLLEQLDPFSGNREFVVGEAGDVTAGMRQAGDKALLDWIGDAGTAKKLGREFPLRLLVRADELLE